MDEAAQPRARGSRPSSAVIVMGVTGCGKSVVGEALAKAVGATFIEGDRLHPPENVAKMARGTPLTDEDRAGWLDAIGRRIAVSADEGRDVAATCSALKRSYRDRLRGFCAGIVFVYLEIDPATARERVSNREKHFMPASLVDSQFAILQPPEADEAALMLDATRPVSELVEEAVAGLNAAVGNFQA